MIEKEFLSEMGGQGMAVAKIAIFVQNYQKMRGLTKNLIGASAASMILLILKDGDSYGYQILQRMKSLTEGELTWQEATIYPMLKELESKGMIKSYWKINESERARKYYTLLDKGKTRVTQDQKEWNFAKIMFSKIWSFE